MSSIAPPGWRNFLPHILRANFPNGKRIRDGSIIRPTSALLPGCRAKNFLASSAYLNRCGVKKASPLGLGLTPSLRLSPSWSRLIYRQTSTCDSAGPKPCRCVNTAPPDGMHYGECIMRNCQFLANPHKDFSRTCRDLSQDWKAPTAFPDRLDLGIKVAVPRKWFASDKPLRKAPQQVGEFALAEEISR